MFVLLPTKCCIRVRGKDCSNIPNWIVSIIDQEDKQEYMIALVCDQHREIIASIISMTRHDNNNSSITNNIDDNNSSNYYYDNNKDTLRFTRIKSIETACNYSINK